MVQLPLSRDNDMEKQKIVLMAVGFVLIATLSFFLTKENNEPTLAEDTTSKAVEIKLPNDKAAMKTDTSDAPTLNEVPAQQIKKEETTEDKVKQTLKSYYQSITEKNFQAAYSILSWDMQNIMGTYENFSRGYDTTISSTAQNIIVVSNNENEFILEYDLIARDRFEKNRVKVQNFKGTATLKFMEERWYIDNMSVKKLGEYTE